MKRIRYKKVETSDCITTDYIHAFDKKYYAMINEAGKVTIGNNLGDVETFEFNSVSKAKVFVRNYLIKLGCPIKKEIKSGILLDKNDNLLVK